MKRRRVGGGGDRGEAERKVKYKRKTLCAEKYLNNFSILNGFQMQTEKTAAFTTGHMHTFITITQTPSSSFPSHSFSLYNCCCFCF